MTTALGSLPKYPLGEEPFLDTYPKSPPTQLQAIPLGPVTGHHKNKVSICTSSLPLEEAVDCNSVSPKPPPPQPLAHLLYLQ